MRTHIRHAHTQTTSTHEQPRPSSSAWSRMFILKINFSQSWTSKSRSLGRVLLFVYLCLQWHAIIYICIYTHTYMGWVGKVWGNRMYIWWYGRIHMYRSCSRFWLLVSYNRRHTVIMICTLKPGWHTHMLLYLCPMWLSSSYEGTFFFFVLHSLRSDTIYVRLALHLQRLHE